MHNEVIEVIRRNLASLSVIKHLYVFGSVLESNSIPNDIDILLIYDEYTDAVKDSSNRLKNILETEFELPVDLTVLSDNEEKEVGFLDRVRALCVK